MREVALRSLLLLCVSSALSCSASAGPPEVATGVYRVNSATRLGCDLNGNTTTTTLPFSAPQFVRIADGPDDTKVISSCADETTERCEVIARVSVDRTFDPPRWLEDRRSAVRIDDSTCRYEANTWGVDVLDDSRVRLRGTLWSSDFKQPVSSMASCNGYEKQAVCKYRDQLELIRVR